jgi:acetoacetate decarboxylase
LREHEVVEQYATPLAGAAFPPPPYSFKDREYLNITYETDPVALRAVVPEPLEIDEPLVRFEVIRMPDVTGLGSYTEAGQVIAVRHGQERGEYVHAMYVDSQPAIASGRELNAFAKKSGSPRLYVDSDTLVGVLDYGTLRVATATMGYKHEAIEAEAARAEISVPTFMLKIMRGYDRRPRICELVRTQITDLTILGAWRSPARLQLFAHALAPLADLPVRRIVAASHILTDLRLAPSTVIHDYLEGATQPPDVHRQERS